MSERTEGPELLDIAIGAAIRLRRKMLGQSQTDLAAGCGITFQQVQKYENGANRVSFSRLVQIAHALDCRVTDLIGDLDAMEGLTPGRVETLELLDVPGATPLLLAYNALPEPCRRPVIHLLQELAGERGTVKLVALTVPSSEAGDAD